MCVASPSRIRPRRAQIPWPPWRLTRMHAYTDDPNYYDWARKTLEAFAGVAPQYGLFAATYGLAATLFAEHPTQVVITGAAGDPAADKLEEAANSVYRLGKAVLRITPDASLDQSAGSFAPDHTASPEGPGASAGVRRRHLLATDERSRRAKANLGQGNCRNRGRINKGPGWPSPKTTRQQKCYFFGRDSGGTMPLFR